MEILNEGLDVFTPEPYGVIVCDKCCGNIGGSCIGHPGYCAVFSNGLLP